MNSDEPIAELRTRIAQACWVLANEGLVRSAVGHVSARVDDTRFLIRCRPHNDAGLASTTVDDVRLVTLDGEFAEPGDAWRVPNELAIHAETYRRRGEVNAVVHAHPPEVVVCSIAGLPLRPIFGAFDLPALQLALRGIPTYERSVPIRRAELAREMLEVMDDSPAIVLRGHGLTAVGETVARATVTAVNVNTLASITARVAASGARPTDLDPEDLDELARSGAAVNLDFAWNHLVARVRGTPETH